MPSMRIKVKGNESGVYHCMSRVVGKEHLLGRLEREVFRKMLWQLADFSGLEVLTYAVMSNHFHVLVRVPGGREVDDVELVRRVGVLYGSERASWVEKGLRGAGGEGLREGYLLRMGDVSQYMKSLKQRFSIWYNRRSGRVGTLWSERFKSVLVEGSGTALRTVSAYIDLNAVRGGLCEDPKDYRYCGYGEAMGGSVRARWGLGVVMEHGDWGMASREYRMILFGKGYYAGTGKGVMSWEQWCEVRERGGRLALADALRCRVRYLSEGTVLGSRAYVEGCFEANREKFGQRRESGARALRGAEWGGLCSVRDLRRRVYTMRDS